MNSLLSHYHQQDPITVDYEGRHPFERRRKLEDVLEDPVPVNETEYGERNEMAPIRIRVLTDVLEAQREADPTIAAQIDTIIESILPTATAEWATHLSVFPVANAIPITEATCFGLFDTLRNSSHILGLACKTLTLPSLLSATYAED
jgi:hypothetical protein